MPGALDRKGLGAGLAATAIVAGAVVAGSRLGRDYDLALLPYTFGVLFAAFAVAYRYAVWLQRPATSLYWRRGWELLFRSGELAGNLAFLGRAAYDGLLAQKFIRRRHPGRWLAHFCFAWGCLIAGAVTFPLVFGWLHFETRLDDTHWYRVVVFGRVVQEFHARSATRYVMFNLLNVSAVLVLAGAAVALRRRLRDPDSLARQQFGNDILPLLLLLAVSGTGLMLTFSTHALHGYGYPAVSLVHAIVVMATLLYLPYGKFFHAFQRPAQLGVALYRRADRAAAACACCGAAFAGAMHVGDLRKVLHSAGMDFTLDGPVAHYADVCPACRRRLFGFTQGALLGRAGNAGDVAAPAEA